MLPLMKNTILALVLFAPFAACNNKEAPAPAPAVAPPAAPTLAAPTAAAPTPTPAAPAVAAPDSEPKLAALAPAEVQKRLKETNFFVFDNNQKERFDKGHIPGAKWVNPSEITAATLPANKSATLVFYCADPHCGACHIGAEAAIKLGYKNVYIMPEGIAGWEGAKLPTEASKA
jgi:rhodanese-related sulfurtransferase